MEDGDKPFINLISINYYQKHFCLELIWVKEKKEERRVNPTLQGTRFRLMFIVKVKKYENERIFFGQMNFTSLF